MKWRIILAPRARRQLDAIPSEIRLTILMDIRVLVDNPFPLSGGTKKLKGFKSPTYRLRSGNFRSIYRVEKDIVVVVSVFDRKNLDRELQSLRN